MFKKKSLYLFILLSLILVVVGCSSSSSGPDLVEEEAHGLKVAFDMPNELLEEVSVMTIEKHTQITKAEVRLYQNNVLIDDQTLENPSENNDVVFGGVEVGKEYKAEVKLMGTIRDESEPKTLYEGENTSQKVESNSITNVNVEVKPLLAQSLEIVEANINSDIQITKVTLKHNPNKKLTKDYSPGVTFKNENGIDLISARWDLIIELEDNRKYKREILLLPAEEKRITIEIDIKDGEIDIQIIVHSSPDAPTGLNINDDNLVWDSQDNIDFYKIYQTNTNSPNDDRLSSSIATVIDNNYSNIEPGYYYWVRSYDNDGYSSGLSEPLFFSDYYFGNFNEYSNDFLTMQYPEDWEYEEHLFEESEGHIEFFKSDSDGYEYYLWIDIWELHDQTEEEFINQEKELLEQEKEMLEEEDYFELLYREMSIDGQDALEVIWRDYGLLMVYWELNHLKSYFNEIDDYMNNYAGEDNFIDNMSLEEIENIKELLNNLDSEDIQDDWILREIEWLLTSINEMLDTGKLDLWFEHKGIITAYNGKSLMMDYEYTLEGTMNIIDSMIDSIQFID